MTYPVMVFVMAILAVVGMLLFIVPVFEEMFEDLGGELPLPTQILVVLSELHEVARAAPARRRRSSSASGGSKHKNDEAVRASVDPIKLKIPVFGPLFKKVAIARFTRNFGTMLGAGVPILQALDIVGETSGNCVDRAGRQGRPGDRAHRAVAVRRRWPSTRSSRRWSCR